MCNKTVATERTNIYKQCSNTARSRPSRVVRQLPVERLEIGTTGQFDSSFSFDLLKRFSPLQAHCLRMWFPFPRRRQRSKQWIFDFDCFLLVSLRIMLNEKSSWKGHWANSAQCTVSVQDGEGFRVQWFGKPCQSCKSDFLQICMRISEVHI